MSNRLIIPPPFDTERDDWGAKVLEEWAASQIKTYPRVLIIGAGAGGIGLPLARLGASVTFADDTVSGLQAAQLTFSMARQQAQFYTTLDLPAEQEFDLALINSIWWPDAERGRELIALAASRVRPGGVIALGGGKNTGIQRAERDLAAIVGPAAAPLYKKGHRVVAALRPEQWQAPAAVSSQHELAIRGHHFTVSGAAGVFANGALDQATAMLLEAVALKPTARVLDLGCGAGIIGMLAARLAPAGSITLVDTSVVAVALAAHNLAQNAITNAQVLASDGVAALGDQRFDTVITNPPFHHGCVQSDAVARRFISEARQVLGRAGTLWLVANRFLRYEPIISESFGTVTEVAGDTRFKVLRASA